ncbi:thioredoxin domain-containing protein [Falsiroseomonas sp. HW251]|uniref:thioredoxin domain-containing protein n=1 Tax=Falsiroseomonas sp. HW251 TaxID=3390998 RepID=UPI003D316532
MSEGEPQTASVILCLRCDTANRVPAARLAEQPHCGTCKHPLFEGRAVRLSEPRARRHIARSGIPVLVEFWAAWNTRCWWMALDIAQAARRIEPGMRLVKVSVEDAPKLAKELGIVAVPTLVLFRDGQEVKRSTESMKAPQILTWAGAED